MSLNLFEIKNKNDKLSALVTIVFIAMAIVSGVDYLSKNNGPVQTLLGTTNQITTLALDQADKNLTGFKQEISLLEDSLYSDVVAVTLGLKNFGADSKTMLASLAVISSSNKNLLAEQVKNVASGVDEARDINWSDARLLLAPRLHSSGLALSLDTFDPLVSILESGFNKWDGLVERVSLNFSFLKDKTILNWQTFLANRTSNENSKTSDAELAALREEIKAEILAEIGNEIQNNPSSSQPLTEPKIIQSQNGQGVVVLPASSEAASSEEIKSQLKNMFSDQTEIKFDASGQSGVITPIFKDRRGQDFIFLITPIKK